jgi:hypothetical protein
MIAKFPGRCARTGRTIRIGDVITFTAARRPVLVQQQHNDGVDNVTPYTSDRVSDTIVFFGDSGAREFYRNRNGRCEDAPCCGCCTI